MRSGFFLEGQAKITANQIWAGVVIKLTHWELPLSFADRVDLRPKLSRLGSAIHEQSLAF